MSIVFMIFVTIWLAIPFGALVYWIWATHVLDGQWCDNIEDRCLKIETRLDSTTFRTESAHVRIDELVGDGK